MMVDLEELGGIRSNDVSWTITYDRIVLPAPAKGVRISARWLFE